jgi:cis-L-3-hydroxyproline dehydratase
MDAALKGHAYVKSGIDIACWDILGQAAGLPVCELLGGRYGDDFHLYRAISQEDARRHGRPVAGYRAEGYRRFQLKVGGDPDVDIERIHAVSAVLQPATGWSPTPTPGGPSTKPCAW